MDPLYTFRGHTGAVLSCVCTKGNPESVLFSGGADATVRCWKIPHTAEYNLYDPYGKGLVFCILSCEHQSPVSIASKFYAPSSTSTKMNCYPVWGGLIWRRDELLHVWDEMRIARTFIPLILIMLIHLSSCTPPQHYLSLLAPLMYPPPLKLIHSSQL